MEDLASVFGKAGNKSDCVLLEAGNYLSCVGPAQGTLGQWLGTVSVPAKGATDNRVQLLSLYSGYAQDVFLSKNTFDVSRKKVGKEQ